jgi:hypothetical protein
MGREWSQLTVVVVVVLHALIGVADRQSRFRDFD